MGVDPWSLGEFSTMDASLWSYHENVEELKYKILCTTMELKACRSSTNEELKKRWETISQLTEIVKAITWERDEAIRQVQHIRQQLTQPNSVKNYVPLQLGGSPMGQIRACSSITESDNQSGTLKCCSYNSSPDDSFFNSVNSPEFSGINLPENKSVNSSAGESDPASVLIDSLIHNRPLPVKGKLLQSVLGAGPLLENLMLAGLIPQWCNPPPPQTFHIPALSIRPLEFDEVVALKPQDMTRRSNMFPHLHAEPFLFHLGSNQQMY